MRSEHCSARQLCALLFTALAAPLVAVCADVSWQWILLAAGGVGLLIIYIVWAAGRVPPGMGYGELVRCAFGPAAGRAVMVLYWLWGILSVGLAARLAADAFPLDRGMPVIPLVLLAVAAWVAAKGTGASCRFGGILFLFVAVLMGFTLLFAATDLQAENLRPTGGAGEALAPAVVLLLSTGGLFFRDRISRRDASVLRWYLLASGLALAVSLICVGALGMPLAKAARQPFWLVSRSISVFGVMERFEAVISSLLAISCCCLLVFLLSVSGRALQGAAKTSRESAAVWVSAVPGAAAVWAAPYVPQWVRLAGNAIFWGALPVLILAIVCRKNIKKSRKKC